MVDNCKKHLSQSFHNDYLVYLILIHCTVDNCLSAFDIFVELALECVVN